MSAQNTSQVSWNEKISSWAYQAGWAVTKSIPRPLATALFNGIADVASKKGKEPQQLRRNLARVVGPENVTRDLVRRSMRSYMRYWREAFQLPAMAGPELAKQLDKGLTPELHKHLNAMVEGGKGGVFVLPHSANWDMAGMWLVQNVGEFTTVAERLRPESLFDAFVEYRRSLGFDVIALTGHDVPPMDHMMKTLDRGGIVCLMGERDLTGRGVVVDFFGEKCSMPAGAALLAKRRGCPLHVVRMYFTEDGWGMDLSEALDTSRSVEEIVQQQADLFAENIAKNPEDWHMLQPLWHADLSDRRLKSMGLDREAMKSDQLPRELGQVAHAEEVPREQAGE